MRSSQMRSSAVPPTLLRSPSRRCDSVVITFATGAVPGAVPATALVFKERHNRVHPAADGGQSG